jgi:hypothetical protein
MCQLENCCSKRINVLSKKEISQNVNKGKSTQYLNINNNLTIKQISITNNKKSFNTFCDMIYVCTYQYCWDCSCRCCYCSYSFRCHSASSYQHLVAAVNSFVMRPVDSSGSRTAHCFRPCVCASCGREERTGRSRWCYSCGSARR